MERAAIRMDLIRGGFQGSDLILRQGMSTAGLIRGGKEPRMYLTGGISYILRSEDVTRFALLEMSGEKVGEILVGDGLTYRGIPYNLSPDPHCPDWRLLEGPEGTIARFQPASVDLLVPTADPGLLLFVGWTIREGKSPLHETTWIGS